VEIQIAGIDGRPIERVDRAPDEFAFLPVERRQQHREFVARLPVEGHGQVVAEVAVGALHVRVQIVETHNGVDGRPPNTAFGSGNRHA
jgi:hypothetical protein